MKPYGKLSKKRWPKEESDSELDMKKIKKMNKRLTSKEKEKRERAQWQIAMLMGHISE